MQSVLKQVYIRRDEYPEYLDHLGKAIHDKRLKKGLSIKKLGELSGVSAWTIGRYENNETTKVQTANLTKIAKALNCETRDLIGRRRKKQEDTYNFFELEEDPIDMLTLEETILRDRPLAESQYIKLAFQADEIKKLKDRLDFSRGINVLLAIAAILAIIFG